jgi:hypothetical protein
VRCVAGQEDASRAERLRDALVNAVDIAVNQGLHRMIRRELAHPAAHAGLGEGLLVALVFPGGKHRAPAPLQVVAHDLEQVGPLLRVGDVAALAASQRGPEIEQAGEHEEPLRPGVPLELDVETLARRAAPSVAADDVVERMLFESRQPHAFPVLRHVRDRRPEPHLDVRHRGEAPQPDLAQLVLLGLDDVGMRRLIAQDLVIEFGDQGPLSSVPELKVPGDQADRLEFL